MGRASFVKGQSSAADGWQDLVERATVMLTVLAGDRPEPAIGTGFVVAPGIVVTCAHVLSLARRSSASEPPPARIQGRIVTLNRELELTSDAVRSFRDPATGMDLAILEVAESADFSGVGPVLLSPELRTLDSLWTYGHPAGAFRSGQKATFAYQGDSRRSTAEVDAIPLPRGYGVPVTAGYSGAPVVNRRTGAVCGMLVTSDKAGSAHLISAADILAHCPEANAISSSVTVHRMWLETLTDEQLAASGWRFAGPRLRAYLTAAAAAANEHPYPGVLPGRRPPLAQVYVRQDTRAVDDELPGTPPSGGVPRARRPAGPAATGRLPADTILVDDDDCLLIGGPGAGKSSLLRVGLVELAERWLSGEAANVAGVPVRVTAADLVEPAPFAEQLARGVRKDLGGRQILGLDTRFFAEPPVAGVPWLVLVDGLDEVLSPENRRRVVEVLDMHGGRGTYRFVVTSRPLSDREMLELVAAGLRERFELLQFDSADLRGFARAWCAAFGMADPEAAAEKFIGQVESAQLTEEARNPLMATMLCQIFANDTSIPLPSGRFQIYESYVELLRGHQFSPTTGGGVLLQIRIALRPYGADTIAELMLARIHEALPHIALARLSDGAAAALEIVRQRSADLRPAAMSESAWVEFLREVLRRSGLLTERGEDFVFLHQTLTEFLAARHIATHRRWLCRLRLYLALGRLPNYQRRLGWDVLWMGFPAYTYLDSFDRFLIATCLQSGPYRRYLKRMIRRLATSRDVGRCAVLLALILDGVPVPPSVHRVLKENLTRSATNVTQKPFARIAAAQALDQSQPHGPDHLAWLATELIVERMGPDFELLRSAALEALEHVTPARLAKALDSLAADAENCDLHDLRRLGAADSLDQLGDPRGRRHLVEMAKAQGFHPVGRTWATRTLGIHGDSRYLDILAQICADPDRKSVV